ncbi:hypothetical protein [Pseudarthrobacter scleromae]|uniref:DUF4209 domain-containing protein n=1 Tax=Pseudarthrobacter scleromae TaxID=158897 RepID=A0ABQ2CEP6_9MICC|nr:hypothetical protein [Pseudarthrobacter scleromae]GGI80471.1 hypothetical protein GCM10007175_17130 [Pseudarthrobacter scleromae]
MSYEFNPADVPVVSDLLEKVATPSDEILKIWEHLSSNEEYKLLDESLRAEIDFVFSYELQEDFGTGGDVNLVQSALSVTVTRPMSETPAGAWFLWAEVHDMLRPSTIRAQVADILLTARVRPKPDHASATVASYLAAAELERVTPQQVALSLARANTIARSRRMTEERAVRQAMYIKSEVFTSRPETSGPALTLLAALSAEPRGGESMSREEREGIRSRLFTIGGASTFFTDEIAKSLTRLADDPAELESARRWHTEQYIARARADDHGMVKMHHAQTAASLAGDYGLSDLRDEAVRIMQSVDRDSMGWESVYHEVKVSKNAFRAYLRKYGRARDWSHALMTFLASPSPSGDHEANKRRAQKAAAGSIRSLITRTVYGTHGLPERTNDDFMEEEITRIETTTLSTTAELLALELEHIRQRFPMARADEITIWMVETLSADRSLAHFFSESLSLHWAENYSDSARLSVPLIESAARGLLRTLDEPLYRTQRGDSPGRFPAMDFYVDALAKRDLDPDWVRALRMTLLTPGMNLRNLAAHGFMMEFSEQQSALLLRLAGLFCAMPNNFDQQSLEALPTMTRRRLRRRLGWVWS